MPYRKLVLACVVFNSTVFAAPPPVSVKEQLQPLLAEMLLAANAHDTDRFMAVYAHNPMLVVTFDDTTIHGWQAVRDQQLQWWENGRSTGIYSENFAPEVTVINDAVVSTLQSMTVTDTAPNGAKRTAKLVATSVWKKLPEG